MADAFCIGYYYITLKRTEHKEALLEMDNKKRFGKAMIEFEKYKLNPKDKFSDGNEQQYNKERGVGDFSKYRYTDSIDNP